MADIKTRDAVKGTIKTIDKAAIASERMKSAYAKTKDKAEQGYYAEESSATEYASDKVSYAADRIKDEGIHQFNKQGQKGVQTTKENIGKAKDKIADFKTKRAMKAAEQKQAQAAYGRGGPRRPPPGGAAPPPHPCPSPLLQGYPEVHPLHQPHGVPLGSAGPAGPGGRPAVLASVPALCAPLALSRHPGHGPPPDGAWPPARPGAGVSPASPLTTPTFSEYFFHFRSVYVFFCNIL